MTGKERIIAILNKQPADKLSWTTIVDGHTLNNLPEDLRGMSVVDFFSRQSRVGLAPQSNAINMMGQAPFYKLLESCIII